LPRAADKKEEKAYNTFRAVPATDAAKKVEVGENFLKAYPKSQLAQLVYPFLVVGYIQMGQVDKGVAAARQGLTINPNDFRTMAVVSQALARTYNPSAPNAEDQLAKADDYGSKALAGAATWKKPEGVTDEAFAQQKSETEAMAHAGVGLVLLRRDKFEEAIPELEKATALNATDQANFYLLGMAEMNTKRFGEAATAFAKCAALSGNLQETCTSAAAEAKKSAGQ
jgi:tetratricopeptide (TPR) repeat protein